MTFYRKGGHLACLLFQSNYSFRYISKGEEEMNKTLELTAHISHTKKNWVFSETMGD